MINIGDVSDAVIEENYNRIPKCKTHKENCMNFLKGHCNALWNSVFFGKDENGKSRRKQCPFYKVDLSYKYVVYDIKYHEIVEYTKTFDDARSYVRVYSGNYYSNGFDDERFKITSWKGDIWKVERDIRKEYEN